MTRHICPVCGYDGLAEPAYDAGGCSSFEICPCCGIEFGYQDATTSHRVLRHRWVNQGMAWSHGLPPAQWDPLKQLRDAGLADDA
ncbi:hypothetical protein [Parvibaculum sp.]|uniref:hypothetical protein n=1 Tax=Parvibaculum sp. TaxID=2024848 RepID=UPI00329867A8